MSGNAATRPRTAMDGARPSTMRRRSARVWSPSGERSRPLCAPRARTRTVRQPRRASRAAVVTRGRTGVRSVPSTSCEDVSEDGGLVAQERRSAVEEERDAVAGLRQDRLVGAEGEQVAAVLQAGRGGGRTVGVPAERVAARRAGVCISVMLRSETRRVPSAVRPPLAWTTSQRAMSAAVLTTSPDAASKVAGAGTGIGCP